ncbi:MAG: TetR/AcrR family transcriptional regulator [Bacteroidota bacterium]
MPPSKAERTRQYILETVAPIFNRQGYVGTSFSDLAEATGLTKGAMYGNFENKEALALAAFNHSWKQIIEPLNARIQRQTSGLGKLMEMTAYYRTYYEDYMKAAEGCAILSVGVDAQYHHPALFKRAQKLIKGMERGLEHMVEQGKTEGSLRADLDSPKLAKLTYAMIEGAVFMVATTGDPAYLPNVIDHVESMIQRDWKR